MTALRILIGCETSGVMRRCGPDRSRTFEGVAAACAAQWG